MILFQVQDNLSFHVSAKHEDQKQMTVAQQADQKQGEEDLGSKAEDESPEKSLEEKEKPEQEKDLEQKPEGSDGKPEMPADESVQEQASHESEHEEKV